MSADAPRRDGRRLSLDEYGRKRRFERTPEPPALVPEGRGDGAVFVVHRHDARRLHWDLRLEMEGVLRSWAVPKGFSYDPRDKHLAIRTEDHPLAYEDFHGVIPKGEYGAGTMTIWDRGHYEVLYAASAPEAVKSGELKLRLYGRKLRGEWHMVKTKGADNQWLLFKSKDRYSGGPRDSVLGIDLSRAPAARLPRRQLPMLPGGEVAPFSDPDWVFEMEFAGLRAFAVKEGDAVRLRGVRQRLPEIERALGRAGAETALLDGVLVALDEHQRPSRALLEERLAAGRTDELSYYAFDLLHFEELDLRPLRLVDRKAALRVVLPESEHVLYVDHVPGQGESLVDVVRSAGLHAVLAKEARSAYTSGASDAWKTIPAGAEEETRKLAVGEVLAKKRAAARAGARVRYSNLGKVFWPAEGYTKGDLIGYYERVADVLLPYLRERPIHMNRYPDGIQGKSFYQRHAKEDFPEWIPTVRVASDSTGEEKDYPICNDRDTLLYLINLGSIDLHPWMSRLGALDSPDWTVIDLDPKEAPFAHVITIARAVGRLFDRIGVRACLKTSGSTGLHVFVPLAPGYSYDQARIFCEGVARVIARELPAIATVERVVGSREGKVYVDYLQNAKGQTVVPPYVVRPVRGATVSAPLAWDELTDDLSLERFNLLTVPPRVERVGDLFAPVLGAGQDLLPAIEALQAYVQGA